MKDIVVQLIRRFIPTAAHLGEWEFLGSAASGKSVGWHESVDEAQLETPRALEDCRADSRLREQILAFERSALQPSFADVHCPARCAVSALQVKA